MRDREVFLREIEYFGGAAAAPIVFIKKYLTPEDCSRINFKKSKFRPSSVSLYYKKLSREQQESVKKRTQEEFEKSTNITYKLNKNVKKDIPYIQHWQRIWECVLRNYMLHSFAPSTYQPSDQERINIDNCATEVQNATALLEGIAGQAFSSFRNILEMQIIDIKAKPSFFEKAIKYLVLGAGFFLINGFPAIGLVTTVLGKAKGEIFHDTLKDICSKYYEDVVDKSFDDKEKNPILKTAKKISLSEYLTMTEIDKFVFSQGQQRDAYNKTKANLTADINLNFANEGLKKATLRKFTDGIIKRKEDLNREGERERFFYISTMKFLTDFINDGADKRTKSPSGGGFIFGESRKPDRDYFDLEVKGGYEQYTGLINIEFKMKNQSGRRAVIYGESIDFDRTFVTVHCQPSDNIEKGLKKIMKNFKVNEELGNPFDMPVRKFLKLSFKDGYEVYIYMDYFVSQQGPTAGQPVYGLTYYYKEPYDLAVKSMHFNSYTVGDSSFKAPYNLNMESTFGKRSCDNLLLNFFNDSFRDRFPKIGGLREMRTNILVSNTQSLDKVKEATRAALLAK